MSAQDQSAASWQDYVDNFIGSGSASQAAIVDEGGNTLAASTGFSPSATEVGSIMAGFQDASSLRQNGIVLNQVKYILVKNDSGSIYGKSGLSGCGAVKSAQMTVIGVYDASIQSGNFSNGLQKVSELLIEFGY